MGQHAPYQPKNEEQAQRYLRRLKPLFPAETVARAFADDISSTERADNRGLDALVIAVDTAQGMSDHY